jgi:hypothetical protein
MNFRPLFSNHEHPGQYLLMLKSICFLLFPACLLAGCGGSSSQSGGLPASPHQGNLVSLPGDRGFVEVLIDSGVAAGDRRTQAKPRIVAYFYQPDGTTEMSPGPSEVKVKVGTGEKSPVLNLSPLPKESGKYASEPGTFPDGFKGELDAKFNGESVQTPFTIR